MKRGKFTVLQNKELAPATFRMVLAGDTEAITAPGQFVNIALTGKFLRRPISVCDWNEAQLTLIYKVVGQGDGTDESNGAGDGVRPPDWLG